MLIYIIIAIRRYGIVDMPSLLSVQNPMFMICITLLLLVLTDNTQLALTNSLFFKRIIYFFIKKLLSDTNNKIITALKNV